METMNIAIPEQLKAFVQREVELRGYSSVSEYVRDLIRRDQERQAIAALEAEIPSWPSHAIGLIARRGDTFRSIVRTSSRLSGGSQPRP